MLKGLNKPMLCRYVAMRHRLDEEAALIRDLAALLSQAQLGNSDKPSIEADALDSVQGMIEQCLLDMRVMLDEFIPVAEASRVVGDEME